MPYQLVDRTLVQVIDYERGIRVEWEWIGEGYTGDYNENDPGDKPLLRFTVWTKSTHFSPEDKAFLRTEDIWSQLDDGSYCTYMPLDTPIAKLVVGALIILEEVADNLETRNYKSILELLSWMGPEDINGITYRRSY
jgi:hypothetical protein